MAKEPTICFTPHIFQEKKYNIIFINKKVEAMIFSPLFFLQNKYLKINLNKKTATYAAVFSHFIKLFI